MQTIHRRNRIYIDSYIFVQLMWCSKKMFIEANPQYKTVTLYDNQMKRMQKEDLNQYHSLQHSKGQEVKQEQKEELKPDKKKEVKQKIGDDLGGSKKKTSRKKGMSI